MIIGQYKAPIIQTASFVISVASLQGIIAAINMLVCILMVSVDYKNGSRIAVCIIAYSIISNLIGITQSHNLSSLPGIITSIVSLASIGFIYYFYRKNALMNYTDLTTGLKNRRKFLEEIDDKMLSKKDFYLACIEIEDFKGINDKYGMQAGDYVLQKISQHLTNLIGKRDLIYKITGAMFAVVFNSSSEADSSLPEITKSTSVKILDGEVSLSVTLACGVSHYPSDAKNAITLLSHADTALNVAKINEEKLQFYNSDMENEEKKQKEAEALVRESLEKNYFYLVYQPQYTLNDKRLRGFETLIRCKKPDGKIISPAFFIPAAEKTNLILKIDDYVLRRAMTEFKGVLEAKGKNYTISVNVSAKNIGTPDFASRVKAILDETAFPPQCLEIEITEYSFAESMDIAIQNIKSLREIGVQIALDDFGTGYTSISQLMKLPINLLKIDKSLIDNIESNHSIRDLVDSVIYMGHIMNCEVISEGVENEQQIGVLKERKCDFVQGFVWGKPLSYTEAINLC